MEFAKWYKNLSIFCIQTNFKRHYQVTDILGKGSFAIVYNGLCIQNFQHVAIKTILKETILKNIQTSVFLKIALNKKERNFSRIRYFKKHDSCEYCKINGSF